MYHITKPYSPLCHHLIKEIENVPQNLLLHRQSSEQAEDFFLVIQQAFADVVAHTHILLFLNNYTYCTETINITAAPIYYLEPNTLITIQEEEMGIKKKYEINNISIPLAYNESMSISATRVFDTIY